MHGLPLLAPQRWTQIGPKTAAAIFGTIDPWRFDGIDLHAMFMQISRI
jgi:hypothetical protein